MIYFLLVTFKIYGIIQNECHIQQTETYVAKQTHDDKRKACSVKPYTIPNRWLQTKNSSILHLNEYIHLSILL